MEDKVNLGDGQFWYIFGECFHIKYLAKTPKCIRGSEIIRTESNTI